MTDQQSGPVLEAAARHRRQLLEGIPVEERQVRAAGVLTAVLEGGEGPPLVLLHGPGEAGVNWRWVIPDLVRTHRVIVPDLPAHGSSAAGDGPLDAGRATAWLSDVVGETCDDPPAVVGHVLGGAIAARFAADHSDRIGALVLVDSLGLAPFRPRLRFVLGLAGFRMRPSEASYDRFMHQCAYDLDALRHDMGDDWAPFVNYNLALAHRADAKERDRLFRSAGLARIPGEELDRITAPTTLIWGLHDRANRLRVAEEVSARQGWRLFVIDHAADDPARDQPEAFLEALRAALDQW